MQISCVETELMGHTDELAGDTATFFLFPTDNDNLFLNQTLTAALSGEKWLLLTHFVRLSVVMKCIDKQYRAFIMKGSYKLDILSSYLEDNPLIKFWCKTTTKKKIHKLNHSISRRSSQSEANYRAAWGW